jgi:nucleoside-diphosphate-sugar epimerase
MKIVVTGGSGLAGIHVVDELTAHGYEVLVVDILPPSEINVAFKLINVEDIGQVYGCLQGADGVIHLAAIPRPTFHSSEVVYRTNTLSTFNVFEASANLGIKRIVYASSISVLGYPFYHRFFEPEFLPIDERHPNKPQDPYALSKYLGEEIAKAYVRSHGLEVVSLRIAWIHTPETFKQQLVPMQKDPEEGASNLWLYVDGRDVGQACRLAIEKEISGHNPFYITAKNTFMKIPSKELAASFYPNARILPEFGGHQSFISSSQAEKCLGYIPQYSWEDYFDGWRKNEH